MTTESILALIRHGLTFAGGAMVTNGMATDADVNSGVGAVMTLIGLGWSFVRKYRNKPRAV